MRKSSMKSVEPAPIFRMTIQTPSKNRVTISLTPKTYRDLFTGLSILVVILGGCRTFSVLQMNVNQTTIHVQPTSKANQQNK